MPVQLRLCDTDTSGVLIFHCRESNTWSLTRQQRESGNYYDARDDLKGFTSTKSVDAVNLKIEGQRLSGIDIESGYPAGAHITKQFAGSSPA